MFRFRVNVYQDLYTFYIQFNIIAEFKSHNYSIDDNLKLSFSIKKCPSYPFLTVIISPPPI